MSVKEIYVWMFECSYFLFKNLYKYVESQYSFLKLSPNICDKEGELHREKALWNRKQIVDMFIAT